MNTNRRKSTSHAMPLPKSAAAATRISGVGGSASTIGRRRRIQTAAGPASVDPPAKRISMPVAAKLASLLGRPSLNGVVSRFPDAPDRAPRSRQRTQITRRPRHPQGGHPADLETTGDEAPADQLDAPAGTQEVDRHVDAAERDRPQELV